MVMYCVQSFFSDPKSCVGWRMLWLPADKIIYFSVHTTGFPCVSVFIISLSKENKKSNQNNQQRISSVGMEPLTLISAFFFYQLQFCNLAN